MSLEDSRRTSEHLDDRSDVVVVQDGDVPDGHRDVNVDVDVRVPQNVNVDVAQSDIDETAGRNRLSARYRVKICVRQRYNL
ncbi:MAG: hypothetical protein ACJ8F2_29070, partial [Xanthobacteraceae bacterium]